MIDWLGMAREWATEFNKFDLKDKIYAEDVAQIMAWGFEEVQKGRNPDVVLKEVLAKINERIEQCQSSGPMPAQNADTSSKLH